ncbi:hypothetical protein TCCBUS3UF1_20870 [Thermus sp. CCB_US3_UF1]|nr:hypothetical protein TCCBUS3UF1_20870 [Thermus sp. CCB_US3_UF1]
MGISAEHPLPPFRARKAAPMAWKGAHGCPGSAGLYHLPGGKM